MLIAFTSANVGSHSTVKEPPQDQVDINLSPTVNNLLTGFDCKNPTNVESLELESVEKCEDRVQKSITKEGYIQILQQSDEYTLSASMCKLRRTKKCQFVELLTMTHHCMTKALHIEKPK